MPADKLSDFLDHKLNILMDQQKQNSVLQKAIGEALKVYVFINYNVAHVVIKNSSLIVCHTLYNRH